MRPLVDSSWPLFFLIYIYDISEGLSEGTKLKLFADDSLLYRIIRSAKDVLALQNDLNLLQAWEIDWKMEFHPGKCQHIRVTNERNMVSALKRQSRLNITG